MYGLIYTLAAIASIVIYALYKSNQKKKRKISFIAKEYWAALGGNEKASAAVDLAIPLILPDYQYYCLFSPDHNRKCIDYTIYLENTIRELPVEDFFKKLRFIYSLIEDQYQAALKGSLFAYYRQRLELFELTPDKEITRTMLESRKKSVSSLQRTRLTSPLIITDIAHYRQRS